MRVTGAEIKGKRRVRVATKTAIVTREEAAACG